ncbi:MAG: family 78 glycoside hydrolase catalytic domain [Clostridia bacterium]|nr:family 78 glycoside hydrolase catalytic domain [Clostridia bacterium]
MNKFFSKNFICATDKYSTREEFKNAPYFRRVFKIDEFNNAEIFICGLGLYQLYINGVNITKGFLAPYINNPDDILYYDKYEVAKYLKEGENCIAVLLGNGFLNSVGGTVWKFDEANFRSSPKFALSFIVDDCVLFNADSKFKTSPSPIIFDDLRIGEHYDANLEQENWNQIGFDDTLWSKVKKAKAPKGKTILCNVEPITLQQEIRPISITPIEGGFLYDFGVNTSGVCRLTINGDRGQKIVLQHGEVLLENKSLYLKNLVCDVDESTNWQRDVFYPKGNCVEIYQPTFTYHGFRYVFIQGVYPEQATEDLLTFLVYNSDLGDRSVLLCDNEVVNSLQKITLNSDLSNFYYFPTDCPQREKNGWMADVAISAEQMLYNFDCVKSLREWLRNVRYAQQTDGALPGIVPTSGWGFEWGNGPAWDIALVEVVLLLYKFSDNIEILNENKNAIKKYIEYLCAKIDKKGLVCFGLPDWCECGLKYEGETFTPLEITDTLVSIDICNKAYTILSILKDNYAEKVLQLRNNFISSFRKIHLQDDMFVDCKTQTAQAKAIEVGIFQTQEKKAAIDNLVKLIHENNDHFKVGVIGARVLFRVLCENGYQDLALKMITQDSFPSYKYWLDKGYTALGEKFYETYPNSILRKDGWKVLSFNHHFWGDISYIFYKYIAGIEVNPTLKSKHTINISPLLFNDINYVKCQFTRDGNKLIFEVRKDSGKNIVNILTNEGFDVKIGNR